MREGGHSRYGSDFARLFGYVRPYLWTFLFAVVLTALVGLLETVPMILIAPLVDGLNFTAGAVVAGTGAGFDPAALVRSLLPDPSTGSYWLALASLLVANSLVKGSAEYGSNLLMTGTGVKIVVRLRRQLYDHVLQQAPAFFHKYPTNSLVAHLVNDTEKIQLGVSFLIADLLREGFTLASLFLFVFLLNWKLTLVFLTLSPLIYLVTVRLGRRLRSRSNEALADTEALLGVAQEVISGIAVVKAFGAEGYESDRFGRAARKLGRSQYRTAVTTFLSPPLLELIGISAVAAFVLYAHNIISSGVMTTGAFVAWVCAVFRLYDPVRRLSRVQNQFQQAFAAGERVFGILDTHTEHEDPPGAVVLPPIRDRIEFRGVTFRYPDGDRDVLDSVDLTIEAGQVVALVGLSGAGKSTLASLLLRLSDPTEGRILVDGVDVRCATVASLRAQVALVTQETILFDDSVRANIAYARPEMTDAQVDAAARAAYADGFVGERPEGYGAPVGERGGRFSGGQRQRLAVARAIAKDAPILVLDEATSALDTHSEREVQRALANLMEGRTTLVIAHRLSTVQRADKIVVLDAGRVAEVGRHDELIERGGLYRALYEMQFESSRESSGSDASLASRPTGVSSEPA
jgi:ATP-binding cassette, subfamily B, bacterial MsbA